MAEELNPTDKFVKDMLEKASKKEVVKAEKDKTDVSEIENITEQLKKKLQEK